MAHVLLFEIGVEELPASFVDAALAALPKLAETKLTALRLEHGAVRALGTPRRLALVIEDLASQQHDLDEQLIGPPEAVAFKDGAPTKAALAFAQKVGVAVEQLTVIDVAAGPKQKAGRFLVGQKQAKGLPTGELLGAALTEIAEAIPFRKSMRWGTGATTFGRPVQWLVALLDDAVVEVQFAGHSSGRTSRGHRFLAPAEFEIPHARDYQELMRKASVTVDLAEREQKMLQRLQEQAQALGGALDDAPILVSENRSLVEEPFVVQGSFEERFLQLPADVIRAVARGHQRYFCLEKPDGSLLSSYLSVVNTAGDPARIAKGQDRVMRARLADAAFFFEEDKKVDPEARVAKLEGIVFHHRLGTVRAKIARLERLAVELATALGQAPAVVAKAHLAAHLCKFDLVSLMVGEFPELQGEMGSIYAHARGLDPEVSATIAEHYQPIGADGALPSSLLGTVVAMADRLDTLAGCFAAGLEPTGAADPYALRRNAIALLRFFLDSPLTALRTLDLGHWFGVAYEGFEGVKLDLDREAAVAKLLTFSYDRLRNLIAARTSGQAADIALAGDAHEQARRPALALAKAEAIQSALGQPWLAKAKLVAKRLSGISKDATPVQHSADVFTREEDLRLSQLIGSLDAATSTLEDASSARAALLGAEQAATLLDEIFEKMLVNDPNDPKTQQRLELLSFGASCMLRLGDFSKLG